MRKYIDEVTGMEITQYTDGPERNAKLYYTTESFTADDRYFFFMRDGAGLMRANVESGEIELMAGEEYSGFAMDWQGDFGVLCRNDGMICRIDAQSGEISELGKLPAGRLCGHMTISHDGRVAAAYQLDNKIYSLQVLYPGEEKARTVYMTDQCLGHSQICPTDGNLLFYIHETGGDALQRTWMFDLEHGMKRPYYVEHFGEWITHETWVSDGTHMLLMKIPHAILLGDKDGRHFDEIYRNDERRVLHPGVSRDMKRMCADFDYDGKYGIMLIDPATGKSIDLAYTNAYSSGADHNHPSFNRSGDTVLFSSPDKNGIAQICTVKINRGIL
ncbi:MAG: hypothetical protein ACOYIH_07440 [Candidatus Fimadaptatus sp.]|jgi:hypothetical protein